MATTPTCPNCGAKFAHDAELAACKKCGLPDEVRREGPKAIARWKRNPWRVEANEVLVGIVHARGSKADRRRERKRKEHPATASKRRNKHGRRGAKA